MCVVCDASPPKSSLEMRSRSRCDRAHDTAFHSIPFHSIPFHSVPFHSVPFHCTALRSQDFLNNVCTHIVHLDHAHRKLVQYRGNYDMFVQVGKRAVCDGAVRRARV